MISSRMVEFWELSTIVMDMKLLKIFCSLLFISIWVCLHNVCLSQINLFYFLNNNYCKPFVVLPDFQWVKTTNIDLVLYNRLYFSFILTFLVSTCSLILRKENIGMGPDRRPLGVLYTDHVFVCLLFEC